MKGNQRDRQISAIPDPQETLGEREGQKGRHPGNWQNGSVSGSLDKGMGAVWIIAQMLCKRRALSRRVKGCPACSSASNSSEKDRRFPGG